MSALPFPVGGTKVAYKTATKDLAEPFPNEVEDVFKTLESLRNASGQDKPSESTLRWANEVLLRVLPRKYLHGAVIDAFAHEIHVTWEFNQKSVTAFMLPQNQLKIYREELSGGNVTHHKLDPACTPANVCEALQWMHQ